MFTFNKRGFDFQFKHERLQVINLVNNFCVIGIDIVYLLDERIEPLCSVVGVLEHHVVAVIQIVCNTRNTTGECHTRLCNAIVHTLIGHVGKGVLGLTAEEASLFTNAGEPPCVSIGVIKGHIF